MPISWDRILQFTARRERQLTGNDFITTNFASFGGVAPASTANTYFRLKRPGGSVGMG